MKSDIKFFVLLLLIASVFLMAAYMPEPWDTVLFMVVIPLVHQAIKFYMDKTGKTLGKLANQIISLAMSLVFLLLAGQFNGLAIPNAPGWDGDLIVFVSAILLYLSEWTTLIGALWGSLMVLYEVIYDRLFIALGLATADKLKLPTSG